MAVVLQSRKTGWRRFNDSDKRWVLRQLQYRCKCGTPLDLRNAYFENILPQDPGQPVDIHNLHVLCSKCNLHPAREQEMKRLLIEYIEKMDTRVQSKER
ncbi:MAG: HNH endonuclease [Thaumarchaeota archaeon]|nr:MAG: HNH endonuclease [Nitrososphaerota archaeon]TLX95838.1 MAG: HNH endonuclease [Nitrososphaerota archaeon]